MPSQKPDIIKDPDTEVLAPTEKLPDSGNIIQESEPEKENKYIAINRIGIGTMILLQLVLAF